MAKCQGEKTTVMRCIIMIVSIVVAALFYSVASGHSIWDIITNANSANGKVRENRYEITDIELQENAVLIQGKETSLKIAFTGR